MGNTPQPAPRGDRAAALSGLPSTDISTRTTATPSASCGPSPPRTSSQRLNPCLYLPL